MTDQSNSPRDWTFRINERQQVSFTELAQVLSGYGFAIVDVVTSERVKHQGHGTTFVLRDEKISNLRSAKPFEELVAERFQALDRRIDEVSGAWKDADDALEAAMLKQREGWAQRFADIEKKIEASRYEKLPLPAPGNGIEVVIHDFPRYEDGSSKLHEIAGALRKLQPTRVIVDMAGTNKYVADKLRNEWSLPVEPMPKPLGPKSVY